jgi:hypothetical protein
MRNKMRFLPVVLIALVLCASFSSFAEDCLNDFNGDGIVDHSDFKEFLENYRVEKGIVDCELPCSSVGLTTCNEECVNLDIDERHCGACNTACADGYICVNGECELTCQADLINCNDECINPNIDERFCGASGECSGGSAGNLCAPGEICSYGACVSTCQQGLIECDGECINPYFDERWCGASGPCDNNPGENCSINEQICMNGACVSISQ